MTIDGAVSRLQDLAQAVTTVTVKSAPDHPVENADPFPMSIAHLISGEVELGQFLRHNPVVSVDIYFSRANLGKAYSDIDAFADEYPRRLGGDPTLNGTVEAIVSPVTYEVVHDDWNGVPAVVLVIRVVLKELQVKL